MPPIDLRDLHTTLTALRGRLNAGDTAEAALAAVLPYTSLHPTLVERKFAEKFGRTIAQYATLVRTAALTTPQPRPRAPTSVDRVPLYPVRTPAEEYLADAREAFFGALAAGWTPDQALLVTLQSYRVRPSQLCGRAMARRIAASEFL